MVSNMCPPREKLPLSVNFLAIIISMNFQHSIRIGLYMFLIHLALIETGCCHALFTLTGFVKHFVNDGSKVRCKFLDARKAFIERGVPYLSFAY